MSRNLHCTLLLARFSSSYHGLCCSQKMVVAMLFPLCMGDSATAAKRALIGGTMDALQAAVDALPAARAGTPPTAAQVLRSAGDCACASLHLAIMKPTNPERAVAQLFTSSSSAMLQAAALSRLAMVTQFALVADGKRNWPLRHTASEGHKWAATLAAATSAAAYWASEEWNSRVTSSADGSGGGDSGSTADAASPQQGPQYTESRQRHRYMQYAARYLGEAVERLLPAAATASLDALEQKPLPSLLTALADVCRIPPESVWLFMQVLQHGVVCVTQQQCPCTYLHMCTALTRPAALSIVLHPAPNCPCPCLCICTALTSV
jgi:hypothetical protein